jgi:hypothetical protein
MLFLISSEVIHLNFELSLIRRHIHAPEILETGASDEEKEKLRIGKMAESEEEEEEEDELSDEEIERRRRTLRQKVLNRKEEEVCFS